jgi:hypothetical protein
MHYKCKWPRVLAALVLACACHAWSQTIISIPAGASLQAAIDKALPGDTILLTPGASYTGNFYLRKKPGSATITIATAGQEMKYSIPARVKPAEAPLLAKILSANSSPAIRADRGSHDYRIAGVEIKTAPGIYNMGLVRFGEGTESSDVDLPYNIELDRAYVHGDSNVGSKRGVALNGKNLTVSNCHIFDFKSTSQDTQAVAGWGGPGPFKIYNNYLEAAGENILFGGTAPGIAGVIPSDIEIIGNHMRKPLSWRTYVNSAGLPWIIKNILELKSARRVLIEGNILENVWAAAQVGFAIVLKAEKDNPFALADTCDIVIRKNIIRNAAGGVNILGRITTSQWTAKQITIAHNLFDNINSSWGEKVRLFSIVNGAQGVTIENNTATPTVKPGMYLLAEGEPSFAFVFRSNIVPFGDSGLKGSGVAAGVPTIDTYLPGAAVSHNIVFGGSGVGLTPLDTFLTDCALLQWVDPTRVWHLSSKSPYKGAGANGADPGYDYYAVRSATVTTIYGK